MSNDTVNVQRGVVGAGSDDDTYVLSANLIDANAEITISDVEGANKIQLIGGLTITSSIVAGDTAQLTLSNGAVVTILGASTMSYEVGGNPLTGTAGVTKDYATFTTDVLGTTVPTEGTATGGESTVNTDGTVTQPTPETYTLTAGAASVDEGATATFSLATTGVAEGTSVAYTISGVDAADVTGGALTGTATVAADGSATISVALAADTTTEGAETLTVSIDGQTASASTTVNDTSLTPDAAQSQALTTGADTLVGGTGDDTFTGVVVTPAANVTAQTTVTAFDSINGGDGNDTLVVTSTATAITAGDWNTLGLSLTSVENVTVQNTAATDLNASDLGTDVTSLTLQGTSGAQGVDLNDAITTLSVNTTGAVDVDDNSGTDVLATVSLSSTIAGDANIDSDAVTTLNLDGVTGITTLATSAGTRALTVNAKSVSGTAEVIDVNATTVNVNFTGGSTATPNVFNLQADAATAINVDASASAASTLTDDTWTAAKTLTITGNSALTADVASGAALTKVDASAATGAQTLTIAATAVDVDGGSGNDTITQAAALGATQNINAGAGDDKVSLTAATALTAGAVVDGGAGTDTLVLDDAVAAAATNDVEEKVFTNFEKLEITDVGANAAIDMANLDAMSYFVSQGIAGAFTLGVSNLVSGGTFEQSAVLGDAGADVTLTVAGAALSTTDTFNLKVTSNAAVTNLGDIAIADVETINITTADAATKQAAAQDTVILVATSATSVNVSGVNGLILTNTGNTKITSFDASAIAADDAATTDTAANMGVSFTSANSTTTATTTITGSAYNDTLVGDAAADTINGGAGIDTLTGGAGNDTINGGDGVDTIDGGAGNDTLTGGAGNDTFVMTTVATNGTSFDTITDATAGDIIQTGAVAVADGTKLGAAVTSGSNAVFQDLLDASMVAAAQTDLAWFQFSGNTYIVKDVSGNATFTNGVDNVIALTGLIDLSNSTSADAGLTIV